MWMRAEVIDASGEVLLVAEAEIANEADLVGLVASVNEQFRTKFPNRSRDGDVTKAGCFLKIGATEQTIGGAAGGSIPRITFPLEAHGSDLKEVTSTLDAIARSAPAIERADAALARTSGALAPPDQHGVHGRASEDNRGERGAAALHQVRQPMRGGDVG